MNQVKVSVFRPKRGPFFKVKWVDPESGRPKQKSTKTIIQRDADRFASRLEKELQDGTYFEPTRTKWKDFRVRYETEAVPGLAKKSGNMIGTAFNAIERIINPNLLSEVNTSNLSRLVAKLRTSKLSETTIRTYLATTRSALAWGFERRLIPVIPAMPKIKRVKKSKMMKGRPITTEEFERMLDRVERIVGEDRAPSWQFFLRGLWLSGLRHDASPAADTITVNDLSSTTLEAMEINFGGKFVSSGTSNLSDPNPEEITVASNPDIKQDSLTLIGSAVDDEFTITSSDQQARGPVNPDETFWTILQTGGVEFTVRQATFRVDTLLISTLGGNDRVDASHVAEEMTVFTIDGGEDNDRLIGTPFSETIIGISLVTADDVDVLIQSDYITSADQFGDSEQFHTVYVDGGDPLIFLQEVATETTQNGIEQIDIHLTETGGNFVLNNDLFTGMTFAQGSAGQDVFTVLAISAQTILRGGDENDVFQIGAGTVDQIDSELFLLGEGRQDSVFVQIDSGNGVDVVFEKNTVQHTQEEEKLSLITNALEFSNVTNAKNNAIGDALRLEAVAFAQMAAAVNRTHLTDVAAQAANLASSSIVAALTAARDEFDDAIFHTFTGQIAIQQDLQRDVVRGLLDRYRTARHEYEEAQNDYNIFQSEFASAQTWINFIETVIIPFFIGEGMDVSFDDFMTGYVHFVSILPWEQERKDLLRKQVEEIMNAISNATGFNSPNAFLADPTWDAAVDLFHNANFGSVIDVYKTTHAIAEEFVDFKTAQFSDFRNVHRNMDKFETFKEFLEFGFDFDAFKQAFKNNVSVFENSLPAFDDLSLEAKLEAQIASLEFDLGRVRAVVGHNSAVTGFFDDLQLAASIQYRQQPGKQPASTIHVHIHNTGTINLHGCKGVAS